MFDWSDFLDVAEALQTTGDQASLRTAVGRAYFAAFRTARDVVGSGAKSWHELPAQKSEDHGLVIRHFRQSRERKDQQIAQYLDALRFNRRSADYDLEPYASGIDTLRKDAEVGIKRAKWIVNELKRR